MATLLNQIDLLRLGDEFFRNIEKYIKKIRSSQEQHPFLSALIANNIFPWATDLFLKHFENYNQYLNAGGGSGIHEKIKSMLVFIMLGTIKTFESELYMTQNNILVQLPMHLLKAQTKMNTVYIDEQFIDIKSKNRRFSFTEVNVVPDDCLDIVFNMRLEKRKIALLSMASSDLPCGNWKYGGRSQEENITRRSNYYQFLYENYKNYYKNNGFPEFGGIYSEGVLIIRGSEKYGYPFLVEPYRVDIIASSPYFLRRGEKPENYEQKTEKKLTAIMKIAVDNNVDTLILAAYGCGGSGNDPDFISRLVLKVLQRFAGFFKTVIISILRQKIVDRKYDNFEIFSRLFKNYSILEPQTKFTEPTVITGNRYEQYEHERTFEENKKTVENYYTKSTDEPVLSKNKQCPDGGACKLKNYLDHSKAFIHPPACHYKGNCTNYYLFKEHRVEYSHPPECFYKGLCTVLFEPNHMLNYMHPELCPEGSKCQILDYPHLLEYSHSKVECKWSLGCAIQISSEANAKHFKQYSHEYKPLCKYEPFCMKKLEIKHLLKLSHLCEKGVECSKFQKKGKSDDDVKHCKLLLHASKPNCQYGEKCYNTSKREHLAKFNHPGFVPFPDICENGLSCNNGSVSHRNNKIHPPEREISFDVFNLNRSVDFNKNKNFMEEEVDKYIKQMRFSIDFNPKDCLSGFEPQHRCKIGVLKGIIDHGSLISKKTQEEYQRNPINSIKGDFNHDQEVSKFIANLNITNNTELLEWLRFESIKYAVKYNIPVAVSIDLKELRNKLKISLENIKNLYNLSSAHVDELKLLAKRVIKNVLLHKQTGIGCPIDEELETKNHVFAIVGRNRGVLYGDIIFQIKKKTMFHPDFNMTPMAGVCIHTRDWINVMPWCTILDPNADFHKYKFHPIVKDWENVMAKIMAAKAHHFFAKRGLLKNKITWEDILTFENENDPHYLIEGHLPSIVPLSFVKKLAIPDGLIKTLSSDQMKRLSILLNDEKKNKLLIYGGKEDALISLSKDNIARMRDLQDVKGFNFGIENRFGRNKIKIPFAFKSDAKSLEIKFEAKGHDIHLSLCKKNEAKLIHIVLNHKNSYKDASLAKTSYITLTDYLNTKKRHENPNKILAKSNLMTNFSASNWVFYQVSLRRKPGLELMMSYKDKSQFSMGYVLNESLNELINCQVNEQIKLKSLRITCWDTAISIKNLQVFETF